MNSRFIIVDLECTCWERCPPAPHETIEIGAVAFASPGGVVDEFQTFVQPLLQPVLSDFCTNLTQIRQADVDAAPAFPDAFDAFVAWTHGFEPFTLSSWGAFDDKQLREDCARHGVTYPFCTHLNLKKTFASVTRGRPCGMAGALRRVGLPLTGTHHRGIDDAHNIARLLEYLTVAAPDGLQSYVQQTGDDTSRRGES